MGGRIIVESVAGCSWNGWPDARGIRIHDVFHDTHGVPLISINDSGFNKSLKNEQSKRDIPICSKLIEMGFLDFVAERRQAQGPDALLFSELRFDEKHLYSRAASRFFCGPVTGAGFIGQHCPVALAGGFNFKSFRRTFSVQLQKSGVPATTIAHLLGHDGGKLEVTNEHYWGFHAHLDTQSTNTWTAIPR